MRRCRSLLSAAVLAAFTLGLAFQTDQSTPAIHPGSSLLNASRIQVSRDTFAIANGQRTVGRTIVETGLDRRHGRLMIIRSERTRNARGQLVRVDSFALDAATLRPLFQQSIDGRQAQRLFFSETRIRGVKLVGNEKRPIEMALDRPLFYANSLDLILNALPLDTSFAEKIAVFDVDSSSGTTITVWVTAREPVRAGTGRLCTSWKVETAGPSGKGTYWIGTRSGRLIRYNAPGKDLQLVRRHGC